MTQHCKTVVRRFIEPGLKLKLILKILLLKYKGSLLLPCLINRSLIKPS
jgi:hypothetical protein